MTPEKKNRVQYGKYPFPPGYEDTVAPKHGRATCSDARPGNGELMLSGVPRCSRCFLLVSRRTDSFPKNLSIAVDLTYNWTFEGDVP